jgi:hypothetical protein
MKKDMMILKTMLKTFREKSNTLAVLSTRLRWMASIHKTNQFQD